MKDIFKTILRSYFFITVGCLTAALVFCAITEPQVTFGIEILWQTLLLGLFCDLPIVIFYSKKELSKKAMLIRYSIHMIAVMGIVLGYGFLFGWFDFSNWINAVVFGFVFIVVYILLVFGLTRYEKSIAVKLTRAVKQYKNLTDDVSESILDDRPE